MWINPSTEDNPKNRELGNDIADDACGISASKNALPSITSVVLSPARKRIAISFHIRHIA